MKVKAILNPRAGLASQRALQAVQQSPFWRHAEVQVTAAAGDARAFAQAAAAEGTQIVLALGGDGTANEVAWGLLGSETTLGLVPVGSGNGLARTLGIPLEPTAALVALEDASRRRMDVGRVEGRPFLNVAGVGLDAVIGADFAENYRRGGRRGVFSYVRLGFHRALSYGGEHLDVEAEGERFSGIAHVVAFSNGRQYGGGAILAPGARLDDGLLDVVVIEAAPWLEVLANAPRLFLGNVEGYRRYRRFGARKVTLTGTRPFLHHRDGEPEDARDTLEVDVLPRVLPILVPRATAEDPRGPLGPPA